MASCCADWCPWKKKVTPIGYLFAFDFDHTIVNQNSDTAVIELLKNPIPEAVQKLYDGTNWSNYMEQIFRFVASEGATLELIAEQIKQLKASPGMISLLESIMNHRKINNHSKFIIISDANTFFIQTYFQPLYPPVEPDAILTNLATNDPQGFLRLTPFMDQHDCKLCPRNLCKGAALLQYIYTNGPFKRIFYIGDGGNDICPAMRLKDTDIVFIRKGFSMERILAQGIWKEHVIHIKAKIIFWCNAKEIEDEINFQTL